jgi:hypothetical protein
MPFPVKQAVESAQTYLSEVMNLSKENLLLEEVELSGRSTVLACYL